MATLWLLRHAKSAWDDPSLADHERPLAPRGRRACERLRRHCAERVSAERVVCSTALRTRQTLERVFPELDPARVVFDRDVYEAPPERLVRSIERHGGHVRSLLLVGHNPGLHALALWLAAVPTRGTFPCYARLEAKLPTGALVTFSLPDLTSLSPHGAQLEGFVTPKGLASD